MPMHIDHLVTEVIDEPETPSDGEATDERYSGQMKMESFLKQNARYEQRLRAEAFDD